MKYTNLQILNELKNIKECHENFSEPWKDSMDNTADCIYNNTWILNYLKNKRYITIGGENREVPFILPYWNDFIKYNWVISCYLKDNQWLINTIIWIAMTIITGILIYIITK